MQERLRTFLRTWRHRRHYPLRLPHFSLDERGVRPLWGPPRPLGAAMLQAMQQCDGRHTVGQIARQTGIKPMALLQQHDQETLLLWRRAVPSQAIPPTKAVGRIILSPHFDDAALSLGGMLLAGARDVLVVDVFSHTGFCRFSHKPEDLAKIQAIRRAEESVMSRLTGAALVELNQPEATLRGHSPPDDFFRAPIGAAEAAVAQALAAAVADLAGQHPQARWFLPLGVGDHIDHRLARNVARQALRDASVPDQRVAFYEDLGYAAKVNCRKLVSELITDRTLHATLVQMKRHGPWKLELLRLYWSQLTWPQILEVGRYAQRIGGLIPAERIWA